MRFHYFLIIAICIFTIGCNHPNSDQSVKLVSWGGKFQQDLMNDWMLPSAKKAKVTIDEGTWNGDYADLSSKISRDLNAWDLVHVEDYYINVPNKSDLFEKIPQDIFDNINSAYKNDYAVPLLEYGYVLVLQKDLVHSIPEQQLDSITWKSFWNLNMFHGKRGLRDFPIGNIEIALLANGKDLKTYLYDSTITRSELQNRVSEAIAKLNEIKDNVIWYTTGDQLQTSLERKETVFTAAWSGRIFSAHNKLCKNQPINSCPLYTIKNSALVSVDWWVIPKNSTNKDNTIRLLREAYSKESLDSAKAFAINQGYSLPIDSLNVSDSIASFYLNLGSSRNPNKISRLESSFWSKNFTWINKIWQDWRFK